MHMVLCSITISGNGITKDQVFLFVSNKHRRKSFLTYLLSTNMSGEDSTGVARAIDIK